MDDILPNDGSFFRPIEPEEQVKERKQEEGKVLASQPLLEDVIADFEDDLDDLSRISCIPVTPDTTNEEFMRAWEKRQEVNNYIERKLDYYRGLKDEYLK